MNYKIKFDISDRKWVWVKDTQKCFVPGYIVKEYDDKVEISVNNEIMIMNHQDICRMNPPKFDMVDDVASLSHLNEPSVLHNLVSRYNQGIIYTYSGLFLLAVNPYRSLNIYNEKYMIEYMSHKKYDLPPHIFGVAYEAYKSMVDNKENQSILITGESGAGKTENTKRVIEFLACVARSPNSDTTGIDKKIILTNTILEAFGNAKTVRNDNSSRFGKFIQIKFKDANISGAHIEKYLLEKSRITKQSKNERNYHIFYQLINQGDKDLKKRLLLDEINYEYLQGCMTIPGVDDKQEFLNLRKAFRELGVVEEKEEVYYKIVSAVLHLGNIKVKSSESNKVVIENLVVVKKVCSLLEISSENFLNNLLHPVIKAGKEHITQSRSVSQVKSIIEGLSRILYDKMFDQIIMELNKSLGTSTSSTFIGVLDIAGFEIFEENGFEQLCINYTNEKLQQFFNHHMFILEQEIYKNENIDWDFIDFGLDLQPTVDLIEKNNPIGILSYLDEECLMPMASDTTLLNKLQNIKSNKYKPLHFKDGFILDHYAGLVEYIVKDWVIKNKDPNFENINDLINKSKNIHVSRLSFTDSNIKRGFFRTVSQKHREQLSLLIKILGQTSPHFVRCILPNMEKSGEYFDNKLVLEQLKCNGVLEGIRISRQGYPSRMGYEEFVSRYSILYDGDNNNGDYIDINKERGIFKGFSKDGKNFSSIHSSSSAIHPLLNSKQPAFTSSCKQVYKTPYEQAVDILENVKCAKSSYKLGKTRIFFRQSVLADLEDMRDIRIGEIMAEIGKILKSKLEFIKKNLETRLQNSTSIIMRNSKLCLDLQNWNWWKLYLKVKPLLDVRKRDVEMKEKEELIKKLRFEIENTKKEANEEITNLKDLIKNLEIKEETSILDLEQEKISLLEKEDLINGLRNLQKNLEQEKKELIQKIDFIEMNLNEEKDKNLNLQKQLVEIKNQSSDEMNLRLNKLEKEKQNIFEENQKLNENVKNICHQLEEKEKEMLILQEEENKLKNVYKMNKSMKDEISDLVYEKNICEKKMGSLENSLQNCESELDRIQNLNMKLVEENKQMKSDIDILNINMESLEKKNKEYRNTIHDLNQNQSICSNKEKDLRDNSNINKIRKLEQKIHSLEKMNMILIQEKDDLRSQHSNLLQTKMNDFFEEERAFNCEKKKLNLENKKLINENILLRKEVEDLRVPSESSEDCILEKFYGLLEKEKKMRGELEQKIFEYENKIINLEGLVQSKRVEYTEDKIKEDTCNTNSIIEDIIKDINTLVEIFNTEYYGILDKNRKRILNLLEECGKYRGEIFDKEHIINNYGNNEISLKKNMEYLEGRNKLLENKMKELNESYEELILKNNDTQMQMQEKDILIQSLISKYEEVEGRYKRDMGSIRKESNKTVEMIRNMKEAFENRIRRMNDINKALKVKNEELENIISVMEKEKGDIEMCDIEINELKKTKDIKEIEPININTGDVYRNKTKELERKKMYLEKEVEGLRSLIKKYENRRDLSEEVVEYKKEISKLNTEIIEFKKMTSIQKIRMTQLERDVEDGQELCDILKKVSVRKITK